LEISRRVSMHLFSLLYNRKQKNSNEPGFS